MSNKPLHLHPDRLFPSDKISRDITRRLYHSIRELPIISPHGHTDPAWFAENTLFPDPYALFIEPDHYVLRMLYSHGISLAALGFSSAQEQTAADPRSVWRMFAQNYYLFRGTPTSFWLNHIFVDLFGFTESLDATTADSYYDAITDALKKDSF